MNKYYYNRILIIGILKRLRRLLINIIQSIFSYWKNKILFDSNSLKLYVQKISYNTLFDIKYSYFDEENALFFNEILQELSKAISLQDSVSHEIYVKEFELEFATYHNIPYAIGVSSGTTALVYSLLALGVGQDDEIITSAHTDIATILAIIEVGAKPVLVDISDDFNMSYSKIKDKISSRTKAIIAVHMHGIPCAIKEIIELANSYGIPVIEDACQAIGATFNIRKVGTFGKIGCFSFSPYKIIGCLGDAGMIITADPDIADIIKNLRNFSRHNKREIPKYYRTPGCLDVIHIPFLKVKLKHIKEIIDKRRKLAQIYNENFTNVPEFTFPKVTNCYCTSYTLKVKERDELLNYLISCGIQAKASYSVPLHLYKELSRFGYRKEEGDFPIYEEFCKEMISLPISHTLSPKQVEWIAKKVKQYYGF